VADSTDYRRAVHEAAAAFRQAYDFEANSILCTEEFTLDMVAAMVKAGYIPMSQAAKVEQAFGYRIVEVPPKRAKLLKGKPFVLGFVAHPEDGV